MKHIYVKYKYNYNLFIYQFGDANSNKLHKNAIIFISKEHIIY